MSKFTEQFNVMIDDDIKTMISKLRVQSNEVQIISASSLVRRLILESFEKRFGTDEEFKELIKRSKEKEMS